MLAKINIALRQEIALAYGMDGLKEGNIKMSLNTESKYFERY